MTTIARRGSYATLLVVGLMSVMGCGSRAPSAHPADVSVKQELLRGVASIQAIRDPEKLYPRLVRARLRLRRAHPTTPDERRGLRLALQGFGETLRGVQSRIDFIEKDSGNPPNATRDAGRADTFLTRGANLLRAAGRALGLELGQLNGY